MTLGQAIAKIRKIKKSFKPSLIKIDCIREWKIEEWYEIITFIYKGEKYEYRSTASDNWIDKIK